MPINKEYVPIDNQPTIKPKTVTGIFTRYIAKTLPLAFDESMSYYECLCALLEYINTKVIPALDNNAAGLLELQEFYEELQTYVNDYFKNLDVQEEINNKLDEMAESGQLTDIIAQYLGLAGMIAFDTVADMKLAENLVNGSKCRTLGFHSYNDGGGAYYKIRTITNNDIVDEMTIIKVYNDTLVAELIINDVINVKQLGAYGDNSHDDTIVIQNAIDLCSDKKGILYFSPGVYIISDTLNISKTIKINGEFNQGITNDNKIYGVEIKQVGIDKSIFYFVGNNYGSIIENIRLAGNTSENRTTIGINSEDIISEFKFINIQFAQYLKTAIRLKQGVIGVIDNCTFSISDIAIDFIRGTEINILNNNFWNNGVDIKVGEMNDSDISNNWFESTLDNSIALLLQAPCRIIYSTVTNNAFQKVNTVVKFDGTTNITEHMTFVNLAFKNNRFTGASPWVIDMKNEENTTNRNTGNRWTIIVEECVFNNATSGQAISIDYDALGGGEGMRLINCLAFSSWTGVVTSMFTPGQTNTAVQSSNLGGYKTNGAIQFDPIVQSTVRKNNSIFMDSSNNINIRNNNGQDNVILVNKKGTTNNRPSTGTTGEVYYDTTIHKPLWWSGSAWLDATGNIL